MRLFIFLFLCNHCVHAQYNPQVDSLDHKAFIIPVALIGAGWALNADGTKNGVRNWIRDRWDVSRSPIDDYMQHAPILMLYSYDLAKRVPKQEVARQSRHLLMTQVVNLGSMLIIKELTDEIRPTGGSHSFPSGHTAYVFASASVLWHTWKDKNKLLAWSGYLPAVGTGIFRMLKDKHWVSDVVFGAGLGILSAHLTYDLNLWNSAQRSSKDDNVKVRLGATTAGFGITVNL